MDDLDGNFSHNLTRRQALKRGAAVAGATLWVAPVVQALSVSPASADRPSGGGGRVDGGRKGGKGAKRVNAGRGNGSEPSLANDLDPGRSGPRNRGGD